MPDMRRLQLDVLGIAMLAGLVFALLAMLSFSPVDAPTVSVYPPRVDVGNWCGPRGAQLATGLLGTFGLGAWLLLSGLAVINWRVLTRRQVQDPALRIAGLICLVTSSCLAAQLFVPGFSGVSPVGTGGYVGGIGRLLLEKHFSLVGSLILITTTTVIGAVLFAEGRLFLGLLTMTGSIGAAASSPFRSLGGLSRRARSAGLGPRRRPQIAGTDDVTFARKPLDDDAEPQEDAESHIDCAFEETDEEPMVAPKAGFKVNRPAGLEAPKPLGFEGMSIEYTDDYELPSLDILDDAEPFPFEELAAKAQTAAATLEKTFAEFGLNVKVSEIDTGPVVTQFELALQPGLRVSKVTGLADDLAVALRVPAVRVVSPIPGKNTVGVEVPNARRVNVRMRELIEASATAADEMAMPLFLGKDVSGQALTVDMAKMPHLLIAGRTGTGKSVCLNTLICSLLMTRSPEEVKMLMIDPKMVELSPYKNLPHLMHPVITDMKQAEAVLAWAVDKMEERYDLLARCGVRHLESYNALGRDKALKKMGLTEFDEEASSVPEHMPYIVVVADEMADMMMTCGKDVEAHIVRLAQKSRAVGIHLVLATQKPTVDVITGLIKSNLPARLSFQVASKTDSRVVLDENGAERLLGYGDMLFLAPATSTLTRAQGTYVSDEEVNDIIDFFSDQPPQYSEELKQVTAGGGKSGEGSAGMKEKDPVYLQAIDVVVSEQRGSCSLLQRHLSIGYGKASRYIDFMFEDGIVGEYNGSKHREVLLDEEAWAGLRESLGV